MKQLLLRVVNKYLSRDLDFRVRLFNVLAIAGTLISLSMALMGIFNSIGIINISINLAVMLLSYALLRYSQRTGKYQRCYTITIVGIFLLLFPLLFFSSGGYHSGMPSFFVFAVAFTIFMLEGKRAVLLSALQIAVYTVLCLIAYYQPQTIMALDDEAAVLIDIIIAFITVSTALGASLFLHFRLYNEQQKQLTERNETLRQITQQKTEFLSNISHELKTPLTVLSSQIQLGRQNVESGGDAQKTLQIMQLVSGEVERMALMVDQMLEAGRIEEGRMAVDPKRESIVEIIQTTLNHYYPVFTKSRNNLTFSLCGDVPAVLCDRGRIAQVLVNLIGNAARHTRGGEINVSVQAQENEVLVAVRDTGEGIAPERIPHLFERYASYRKHDAQQGAGGRTERDTGTGLGLYICKYLVETHEGRIWIESELQKGTTVFFTLPQDI